MSAIMERLRRGERYWPAELALRSAGLILFGACALPWRALCRLAGQPAHGGSPLELVVAAAFMACLWAGLALLFEGPFLFRLLPMPPRALLP